MTVQTLDAAASPNVITIAAGQSFNVSDVFRVGTNATTTTAVPTALNVTGGGTLNVSPTNNANFILGVGSGVNANATMNVTMDMRRLVEFCLQHRRYGHRQLLRRFRPLGPVQTRLGWPTQATPLPPPPSKSATAAKHPGFTAWGPRITAAAQ